MLLPCKDQIALAAWQVLNDIPEYLVGSDGQKMEGCHLEILPAQVPGS
jgi:hypothetical protein